MPNLRSFPYFTLDGSLYLPFCSFMTICFVYFILAICSQSLNDHILLYLFTTIMEPRIALSYLDF